MLSWPQPELKLGAGGIGCPVAALKRLYAATVTSVWPLQKPLLIVTWCVGFSSREHLLSPGEQPIMNVPGGIRTYFNPSFGFSFSAPAAGVGAGGRDSFSGALLVESLPGTEDCVVSGGIWARTEAEPSRNASARKPN
jgi:hypothetical protein